MKKLICLMLLAFMLFSASAETSLNSLGLNALNALYDGQQNQMISPISLAMALSMAAEGANGETKAEILNVLNSDGTDWSMLGIFLQQSGLRIANTAFSAENLDVKEDYVLNLQNNYSAEWFAMDDHIVENINTWTSEHTDGLIEKMLDSVPSTGTQLILLNAVAMDAEWHLFFGKEATQEEVFQTPYGDVMVSMMRQTEDFEYGETEAAQLLRLYYRGSALTMLIALPKSGHSEREILNTLCDKGLSYFSAIGEAKYIKLALPKVDFEASNALNDYLKSAGITTAFATGADFSAISDKTLYLDSVIQKSHLLIDEFGTKAASVTEVAWASEAVLHDEPIDFTIDHPFVVLIADEAAGIVCFAAVISDPR